MTFHDARQLDAHNTVEADLCILGGGAAGITLARAFIGQPVRVVLLESGDHRFAHRAQFLYRGEMAGVPNYATTHSRFRMFGGSTTRWTGQCRPLDGIDFEARDWVAHSGWPFDRSHLDPWYQRASATCMLASADFDPSGWARNQAPILPLAGDDLDVTILQFGHPRDFGQAYGDELAAAANVDVFLHANGIEIDSDADVRRVSGIKFATLGGKQARCQARAYVLACGGIENARLLLASNQQAPAGLGNGHDLVGRFFMDHPYLTTGYYLPSAPGHDRGLHVIEDFDRVGAEQPAHAAFTLSDQVLRQERLNGCAGYFFRCANYRIQPAYFAKGGAALAHLADILRHRAVPNRHFGRTLADLVHGWQDAAKTLGRSAVETIRPVSRLALRTVVEATPNPDSRVTLTNRRDSLGMPRVRVDWRMDLADRRGLDRLRAAIDAALIRRGLGQLIDDPSDDAAGWPNSMAGGKHHMGTTRMHVDPRHGVVDPDLKVHGLANLYVAGSSVFPTGGWANPTFTIVALTLRLADHLKDRLQRASPPG